MTSATRIVLLTAAMTMGLTAVPDGQHPRFFPDDPLRVDDDMLHVPEAPAEMELSDLFDRFRHIVTDAGSPELTEAQNVNTLDEVPDSSWFTNRHGQRRMSLEELRRGPDTGTGPDMSVPWRVFRTKVGGLTPGFQIIDGRGERYVIKFDPVGRPELSSAAEVIGTKVFYALGYHTPENYIAAVDPEAGLTIEPGTLLEDEFGDEEPLTQSWLRRQLRRVPRLPDGRVRVTASRYLEGRPLGPFRYHGTRTDDPNDIVLHENRRELRGLRLFAAWTNHDDTRAHNTQNSYVDVEGRRFVRHYLLDFGSTFGSGSVDFQLPNLSFHYWLDLDLVKKNIRTFGLSTPTYRLVKWPPFPEYDSVGRWESTFYEPHTWRNDYPNPAFVRMTDRDAFWAAAIMMRLSASELRAIVETGQFTDRTEQEYFLKVLVERQRKTGHFYLNRVNPLAEFSVTAAGLTFVNLSERYGFATPVSRYRVQWSLYDNAIDRVTALDAPWEVTAPVVSWPADSVPPPDDCFLLAEVHTLHPDHPQWNRRVAVYLRPTGATYEVVGIDRETDPPSPHGRSRR